MINALRRQRLESLLLAFQPLWRPQPFKIETPAWCTDFPALCADLLALDDAAVDRLTGDDAALIALLAGHFGEIGELAALIEFPVPAMNTTQVEQKVRFYTDIPGRKRTQIAAYAEMLGPPVAPVLEWCAGKGHLGRLLAGNGQEELVSLEIDPILCEAGARLAQRAGVDHKQRFTPADVLSPASNHFLAGRHAIALHACGDLHRQLLVAAVAQASPAIDLAPCCYYRTQADSYQALAGGALSLDRDDLRLAVTDTVTAPPRLRRRARRALAWKLGWVELRTALTGEAAYQTFPPVPDAWLRDDFAAFIHRMLERETRRCGLARVDEADGCLHDLARYESLGQARASRMSRLQLVRLAFRRALEVWLIMDMAVFLENHAYRVTVRAFCPPQLTPRNLLLTARRYT